ncbi:MAG: serine hydrolase domain-containing protein, partial [Pseudomonadota bacterium]
MPRRLALLCLTLMLAGCAAGLGKITPWRSGAVPSSAALEDNIIPRGADEQDPAVRRSIAEAQEELLVPSVSVAVMRRGRIDWTQAYGEGIDPNTRYQAASLSKAVAAAGILRLAEIENVDLDTDISSDLTDVDLAQLNPKGLPITLRGLLSHTNGMTGRGYPGYAAGRALPTTAQVINGSEVTNTKPVQLKAEWVGTFHYSGGGYTLAQRWAETISGKNFADLMEQLILKPVGMKRSTFALHTPQTFPTDNVARAFVRIGKPIDG